MHVSKEAASLLPRKKNHFTFCLSRLVNLSFPTYLFNADSGHSVALCNVRKPSIDLELSEKVKTSHLKYEIMI